MNWKEPKYAILVLTILYIVGVFGILIPIHEQFILLTPLNLLTSLGLVLIFHKNWTTSMTIFVAIAFSIGFGIEILGVQTGLVFGEYSYGKVLGPKLLGTPFMIGVNWIMLTYCSAITIQTVLPKLSKVIKAIIGAATLVLLDFLIEPIAIQYDFWSWGGVDIPIQNYIAWFIISFGLSFIFYQIVGGQSNKVAIALLILQFAFFGILNIF